MAESIFRSGLTCRARRFWWLKGWTFPLRAGVADYVPMYPLVSILMPAYNARRWIREALESALGQTWPRKEIIVVNDGSTDGTFDIAKSYESRNVRVLTQANRGASAARNAAMGQAQGDYIQWLDADDVLAPDKIARQMSAAASLSPSVLLSGPWAYFHRNTRRAQPHPSPLWADHMPIDWLMLKMGGSFHMQTGTWLTSRQLMAKAGLFDEGLWRDNDGEFFGRVVAASDSIRFVPGANVYYRQVPYGSITDMTNSSKKRDSLFRSMTLQIEYLRALEDSPRVRAVCVRYLQNWLLEFYPERPDLVAKAARLAEQLGGSLSEPKLSPKYEWMRGLIGLPLAKRLSQKVPRWHSAAAHLLDRMPPVT
jgi:glycosyltransferase involved in cell wall biosynthesis